METPDDELKRLRQRNAELEAITADAELELARAHLAAIVESSDDAMVVTDLSGIVQTWNKGAERLYGYSAAEMIGRSMSLLLPADRPDEESTILKRLSVGGHAEHFKTARMRKDGKQVEISLSISPICDRNGRVVASSHVARDIQILRALELRLLGVPKLESFRVLACGVAGDFNNLLTGILSNSSLVAEGLRESNPDRRVLGECITAAECAARLTKQLLAYGGEGRVETQAINLSVLMRQISPLIQSSISRKVHIQLELADDLPLIEADAPQLEAVVMNLVVNGAEATGEGTGMVVCKTTVQTMDNAYITALGAEGEHLSPGKYVMLEVRDCDCGMDEATLLHIPEPFFSTKSPGRGTAPRGKEPHSPFCFPPYKASSIPRRQNAWTASQRRC